MKIKMKIEEIKQIFNKLWYKWIYTKIFWSNYTFQKLIIDKKWKKYFLNFNYYEKISNLKPTLELMAQFNKNNITINITIFSIKLSKDITEKEIIQNIKIYEKEVETIFNKMWYDYYECI